MAAIAGRPPFLPAEACTDSPTERTDGTRDRSRGLKPGGRLQSSGPRQSPGRPPESIDAPPMSRSADAVFAVARVRRWASRPIRSREPRWMAAYMGATVNDSTLLICSKRIAGEVPRQRYRPARGRPHDSRRIRRRRRGCPETPRGPSMSLGLFRAAAAAIISDRWETGKLMKTEAVAIAPPAPVSPTLDIRVTSVGEVVFLIRNDQLPSVIAFDPDQLPRSATGSTAASRMPGWSARRSRPRSKNRGSRARAPSPTRSTSRSRPTSRTCSRSRRGREPCRR